MPEKQAKDAIGSAPFFALEVTKLDKLREEVLARTYGEGATASFLDIRSNVATLPMAEAAEAGLARQLIDWHRRNRFCPGCGKPMVRLLANSV